MNKSNLKYYHRVYFTFSCSKYKQFSITYSFDAFSGGKRISLEAHHIHTTHWFLHTDNCFALNFTVLFIPSVMIHFILNVADQSSIPPATKLPESFKSVSTKESFSFINKGFHFPHIIIYSRYIDFTHKSRFVVQCNSTARTASLSRVTFIFMSSFYLQFCLPYLEHLLLNR